MSIFVLTGSLYEASSKATLATSGETHDISKSILPGFTGARYISGLPFPHPIGTSRGFFVYGRSGNMRIQSFPPFLRERTIDLRAASICREVMNPDSTVFIAKLPKAILEPFTATPLRVPRWDFRYFVFFGCNISFNGK